MKQLTEIQKLNAIANKYYSGLQWTPKTGDYYTTSRADLELYQIVEADEKVIRTKYCDESRGDTISEWPVETFLKDFGVNRVWVPDWVIKMQEEKTERLFTLQEMADLWAACLLYCTEPDNDHPNFVEYLKEKFNIIL
jgi:hypothetical protein